MGDSSLFTDASVELNQVNNLRVTGQGFPTPEQQRDIRIDTSSQSSRPFDQENAVRQHLLPTDGGPAAWRVLIAAFVFEALLWGMYSCSSSKMSG